jgi:DNA-binding PadR family transcriptional regulator
MCDERTMPPKRLSVSTLPLKPTLYLMLAVLVDEEHHGYAIKHAVADLSDGDVVLDPGTLYRHLGRLLEDGLVEESDERPDPELDDARRRYYRLTGTGRALYAAETERMARLVEAARLGRITTKPGPA